MSVHCLPPWPDLAASSKAELRRDLQGRRAALPAILRARRSLVVCDRLLNHRWFVEARAVALFWPLLRQGEIDLRPVDRAARALGKAVYYPYVVAGKQSTRGGFRRTDDASTLSPRGHGFAEPDDAAPVAERGAFELLVLPALGVSPTGHRLGHGGGFYDAVLPAFRPPARVVVVAFEVQVVTSLPVEQHDQPCDLVLTDERMYGAL